jgi:hypothetical protein
LDFNNLYKIYLSKNLMSRSFYPLDQKEFSCYGPNDTHKIREGVPVRAEIGELYGRYWTAFVGCQYNHSDAGRCTNPETGGHCKCPYRKMGEAALRVKFFPNARTGALVLRE